MQAGEENSYQFQRARIERIAGELVSGGSIAFDEPSTFIRFVIKKMGTNITESSGDWLPSYPWLTLCLLYPHGFEPKGELTSLSSMNVLV